MRFWDRKSPKWQTGISRDRSATEKSDQHSGRGLLGGLISQCGHSEKQAHTCTEVAIDPPMAVYGLLSYFDGLCCTWTGHSSPHLRDDGAANYHSSRGGKDGENMQWTRTRWNGHGDGARAWCQHDSLISHRWPSKVLSVGTTDLFTLCQ